MPRPGNSSFSFNSSPMRQPYHRESPTRPNQPSRPSFASPPPPRPPPPSQPTSPTTQPTTSTQSETVTESQPSETPIPPPRKYPKVTDFSVIEELSDLSVKQLKELLSLYRVDYKGCVEKAELLERAQRLWNDANKHKTEGK